MFTNFAFLYICLKLNSWQNTAYINVFLKKHTKRGILHTYKFWFPTYLIPTLTNLCYPALTGKSTHTYSTYTEKTNEGKYCIPAYKKEIFQLYCKFFWNSLLFFYMCKQQRIEQRMARLLYTPAINMKNIWLQFTLYCLHIPTTSFSLGFSLKPIR